MFPSHKHTRHAHSGKRTNHHHQKTPHLVSGRKALSLCFTASIFASFYLLLRLCWQKRVIAIRKALVCFIFCDLNRYPQRSAGTAKSILHEVPNEASQKSPFFVAVRGTATLSYRYRGNITADAFIWQTLSPETRIAQISKTLSSSALLPYSIAGNVAQGHSELVIRRVNASLNGKVYRCFVDFPSASTPSVLSGQVTLTLKGELFAIVLICLCCT